MWSTFCLRGPRDFLLHKHDSMEPSPDRLGGRVAESFEGQDPAKDAGERNILPQDPSRVIRSPH